MGKFKIENYFIYLTFITTVFAYFILGFSACGAPATPVRRSAVILAPHTPITAGKALKKKEIKITGGLNPLTLDFENNNGGPFYNAEPDVGDAGVFMPNTQIDLEILGGVSDYFELGGAYLFGDYAWSSPSSIGVLEIPPGHNRDVYAFGPAMRLNLSPNNQYIDVGLSLELLFASIPQATYVCSTCKNGWVSGQGAELYTFYKFERENMNHWDLSFHISGKHKIFSPYFSLGIQNTVTNIGFDQRYGSQDDDTLKNNEIIGLINLGSELELKPFYWDISLYYPFDHEQFDFSIGIATTIGIKFGIGKKEPQSDIIILPEEGETSSIFGPTKNNKTRGVDAFPILN